MNQIKTFLLISITFLVLNPTSVFAEVNIHPLASCYESSGYYGVKVNGNSVPVARYNPLGTAVQYYFAHLSASGSNTYEIEGYQAINSYTIRPSAYGINGNIAGTKLSFTVNNTRYLEIQINSRSILYLMIDPIETGVPNSSGSGIYNVTSSPYNANNTGAIEVTSKIQQAINAANSNGGGTVYVPAGVYVTGPLFLKSNVDLYLKEGAVLLATLDRGDYPNRANPNHIVKINNASNVKVYGRGSIYCRGVQVNNYVRTDASGELRLGPIQVLNSNNVTIDGVYCVESTAWSLTFTEASRNCVVRNVKILNEMTWAWNDGINVIGSHDISVEHCFVSTADDAACVKAQTFPKADPGDQVYNVTYNDMVVKSGISSGFKVGMQAEDDIYNVWAQNFNVLDCERAFNIDHWYGDGHFFDIHFVDWTIDEITGTGTSISKGKYVDCPFRIEIVQQPSSSYEVGLGKVSDIEITRVKFNDFGANDSYFWGNDATNSIDRVAITDLYFGNTLVTGYAIGHIQNKGFAYNVTFNSAPTVGFATPAAGIQLNAGQSVSVDITASDSDGSIDHIDLFINDIFIRSEGVAPYLWNQIGQDPLLVNLAVGTHTLKAVAYDNNNASSEVKRDITVNDSCSIVPYSQINNGAWTGSSNVTVAIGTRVEFGPQSDDFGTSGGTWSWTGPNGYTSNGREITLSSAQSNQAGTYTVTDADQNNCIASHNFILSIGSSKKSNQKILSNIDISETDSQSCFIYPNPVSSDTFSVNLEGINATEISIFSIGGKHLYHRYINNENSFCLTIETPEQSGFYLIRISDREKGVHTRKLIVK